MNILGACNAQDSGAALIGDGRLVAAANEKRFVREKLVQVFPAWTIAYVIEAGGITPADVDWVGYGAWAGVDEIIILPRLIEEAMQSMAGGADRDAEKWAISICW